MSYGCFTRPLWIENVNKNSRIILCSYKFVYDIYSHRVGFLFQEIVFCLMVDFRGLGIRVLHSRAFRSFTHWCWLFRVWCHFTPTYASLTPYCSTRYLFWMFFYFILHCRMWLFWEVVRFSLLKLISHLLTWRASRALVKAYDLLRPRPVCLMGYGRFDAPLPPFLSLICIFCLWV